LLSLPASGADAVSRVFPHSKDGGRIRPEVRRLLEVLGAHSWRRDDTARALGISRSTLWRRMKEYGLV
jgi:transcriptional regulator of acetoin/glycerol metabolism